MKIKNFKYFFPEKPSLMLKGDIFKRLSNDPEWIAERKYNGSRLQLHVVDGKFQFWNRHYNKFDYVPSVELQDSLEALDLKGYCLFDGELRHNKVTGIRDKIMLYDVFIWGNQLLIDWPFCFRRALLLELIPVNGDPLGVTEWFQDQFHLVFREVLEDNEIEGLVIKHRDGRLNLGRSRPVLSKWMYKVRRPSNSYRY